MAIKFAIGLLAAMLVWGGICPTSAKAEGILRVAYFSHDLPGIDPLSPTFDPDSYSVITQLFDSLVYHDLDGDLTPGLAVGWRRLQPTVWEFKLRKGVVFHNGEPFDSRSVKATYDTALDPNRRAGNAWILNSIKEVRLDPADPYRVVIETHFPDGMFLNRLSMFGSLCPPRYLTEAGLDGFAEHPVGTGPYMLSEWAKGKYIELVRNPKYWAKGLPKIDKVRFLILPEEQWVDAFLEGKVDFLPNLAGNETTRLMTEAKGKATILKRLVLAGYWTVIRNQGVLADRRVRKALNLALNKQALVTYADKGNAEPLSSLGKKGEFGANPELEPYPYNPEQARRLLKEATVETPLKLTAIVADIAAPVAKIMRHDFAQIGIDLELDIVPRVEWSNRLTTHKMTTGEPIDYDLAINLVDNPIYNLAFHAGLFLHSTSPWSLLSHPEFEERFGQALTTVDPSAHRRSLEQLDKYIHDEALMVFTTQRIITAAVSPKVRIPKFGMNGHLDYLTLTTAEAVQP